MDRGCVDSAPEKLRHIKTIVNKSTNRACGKNGPRKFEIRS